MKVGDLVKIKYDGVVTIVTAIESIPHRTGFEGPDVWYSLLGQEISFRAAQLEVVT
tara:strand:- start:56 stop:223 length:168 start_codon:yes stop_codon:yes gene_type:complete